MSLNNPANFMRRAMRKVPRTLYGNIILKYVCDYTTSQILFCLYSKGAWGWLSPQGLAGTYLEKFGTRASLLAFKKSFGIWCALNKPDKNYFLLITLKLNYYVPVK